ncbi:hypothetical protein OQG75_18715 [Acinetobacter baumannii]|jgi:hypothetical protein|uniref:hypothetical protein n=1 Tax=Acinetobacter TaxID=469 RepID=UPI00148F0AEB|nr:MULTISPECIES: hypothetical protein [Acinetobacter]MDU4436153.1 hypothetical protein [Pluralibacter gergoviae]MCW8536471.1 hypothetical protein [Acinetobacter baumannii]MCW8540244.1 hypothetical protein [Acinetobacter baumannii]MCW8547544.1 hypothetical protein [Acinetobacter baumannii]MCW8551281.1 hypothetical protein [Acinetobacter baumannii]
MAVSDSQKRSWLNQIDQARKKILDIQSKAQRDIAYEQKKIVDLENKLRNN